MTIDLERVKSIVESLIFVSDEPLSFRQIRSVMEGISNQDLKQVMSELMAEHESKNRGFHLVEVAEGYQFRSRPENAEWIRMLIKQRPQRLSLSALETLAIIAYRQPVTKPEIEEIRGVDSGAVIGTLLHRNFIRILGRKDAPGKPFIYGTTKEFLEKFNLRDLSSLPSLREIEDLSGVEVPPGEPADSHEEPSEEMEAGEEDGILSEESVDEEVQG